MIDQTQLAAWTCVFSEFLSICSGRYTIYPHIYVMRKSRIWTILGLSCANLRFDLCVGNPRNPNVPVSINPLRVIIHQHYVYICSSGEDTVNVPKPLSSLAKRVPYPSDSAQLCMKLAMQARARERSRASSRAKVRGKGQARVRTMGPGLKPELGLDGR